jgi:predicted nucleic acid-binding protein
MVEMLLDSVILIDHLNGIPESTGWLADEGWDRMAVSAITRAEVLTGAAPEELAHIGTLLDSFTCFPLDGDTADRAASIRREKKLRLPDAFQAAVAEIHKLKLVTRNTRDFSPEKFDYVIVPYTLT